MKYQVTHVIDVAEDRTGGFGLNLFTQDCPSTIHNAGKREARRQEERHYTVISCGTKPVEAVEGIGGTTYMDPAIARRRHTLEGTANEERVTYSFPVDCQGWLATLLMRQGYGAIPEGDGLRVVTKDEADRYEADHLTDRLGSLVSSLGGDE